jgi:hypothetical protein
VPGKVLDGTPYTRTTEATTQINTTNKTVSFIGANPFVFANANYTMGLPAAFAGAAFFAGAAAFFTSSLAGAAAFAASTFAIVASTVAFFTAMIHSSVNMYVYFLVILCCL